MQAPENRSQNSVVATSWEPLRDTNSPSIMVRSLKWLDQQSPIPVCLLGLTLVISIGFLSSYTGPQLSSSFLYLIPLLIVTRVAGFRIGGFSAALAATIWLWADINSGQSYDHPVMPYWNALMRLATFLVAVGLVSATKTLNSQLEDRVLERTAALKAQIAENRELERSILEISDRERAAVGQDLHDGLCQQLVSAAFSANMLRDRLSDDKQCRGGDADRIADMIDEAITQARNLARGLYPVRLETEGLEMALHELSSTIDRRHEIECTVHCPTTLPHICDNAAIHLYRIAQEAVMNAAKHANAKSVMITASSDSGTLKLCIDDDGIGIDPSKSNPEGMGLSIMEYRARMIGAEFKLAARSGLGTRVECTLDLKVVPS